MLSSPRRSKLFEQRGVDPCAGSEQSRTAPSPPPREGAVRMLSSPRRSKLFEQRGVDPCAGSEQSRTAPSPPPREGAVRMLSSPRRSSASKAGHEPLGYSMTSSTRASSVGGISSPSAFAVFRLITSS